jgi:hypothetical protein
VNAVGAEIKTKYKLFFYHTINISIYEMEFIVQEHKNGCCVASIAMFTAEDYMKVITDCYEGHDFEKLGLTTSQIKSGLEKLGINDVKVEDKVLPLGFKAILIVKSLNVEDGFHCVFWDGYNLYDPLTGKKDKKVYDTAYLIDHIELLEECIYCSCADT